jgi:hypothetical protein
VGLRVRRTWRFEEVDLLLRREGNRQYGCPRTDRTLREPSERARRRRVEKRPGVHVFIGRTLLPSFAVRTADRKRQYDALKRGEPSWSASTKRDSREFGARASRPLSPGEPSAPPARAGRGSINLDAAQLRILRCGEAPRGGAYGSRRSPADRGEARTTEVPLGTCAGRHKSTPRASNNTQLQNARYHHDRRQNDSAARGAVA